jgi:ribosomal protein S18 acetylase RimI-like enzyme
MERLAEIKVDNWADSYRSLVEPAVLGPFLDLGAQTAYLKESMSSPDTLLLVAEAESGELVGFALAYVDREAEPWLESLHVAAEFRGRGAGTALMRDLAARFQQRGHQSLRLGVVKGNDGAGRLYERLGATIAGEEPTAWAAGVDHVIYRWPDLAPLTHAPYNPADDERR